MSEDRQITGRQISAARALLGMLQDDLSRRSNVSLTTIRKMEGSKGTASGLFNNVLAVRRQLELAGIVFLGETGLRLREEDDRPADVI